ncbi:transmembrane protein, putative (macronuclear) [Tetrahymena thermophila SB210]|uniref:Transmembrane protein, putative n=1 Tax=Tetrahymena thermophila (strain SB210) TaxID=312017 RepID=Q23FC5_TETTS|nr:transmembrane protein, putative [Tetrahymena thermophila SB210]EAR95228.2 transmembrane protein, putative [Tetrahymena thermophila SB210]|eukprot:XP_001015473.2 transmembrane protein, putative [Tetrahymena thermophila SB210]
MKSLNQVSQIIQIRCLFRVILVLQSIIQIIVAADNVLNIYVNSDSPSNGDGSQAKPYQDLFYAMNIISKVVTEFPQQDDQSSNPQIDINAANSYVIYLNADAQKAYNMFNPANSPKSYLINSAQAVSIMQYSSGSSVQNKPTIQLQDFLQVQNTSFSLFGCKLVFIINDANKLMQQQTKQICQLDLIGSIPQVNQVTLQILDQTTGGYIPTEQSIIKLEKKLEAERNKINRDYLDNQGAQSEHTNQHEKQDISSGQKQVYLQRSFFCTHQQKTLNAFNTKSPSDLQKQKGLLNNTNLGNQQYDQDQIIDNKFYIKNTTQNQELKIQTNSLNDSKLKLSDPSQCAFNQLDIIDSYIKVDSENFYKIWVGSIIELNFASNDIFDINTCELSNIQVKNLQLASDIEGSIFKLNYNSQQDVDFQSNVVKNIYIDTCTLYMVNIFELNLLQSEMKECIFKNFTLTNSLLQSSVGLDQSEFIKISIQNTQSSIKRSLYLIDHTLKGNKFINGRFFSVQPELQTEQVRTIIQNITIDNNYAVNTNSQEVQMFSNATQINIFDSNIQNNVFEQIVVFESNFFQVVDTIVFNNNQVYNNTLTNSVFYSANVMDASKVQIENNLFYHNYQIYNESLCINEQVLIQSTMFKIQGKPSNLSFLNNNIRVGKPIDSKSKDCNSYYEQFTYFMHITSVQYLNIQYVTFEDICTTQKYFLKDLSPKYFQQGNSAINSDNLNSETRGGFVQVSGFLRVDFKNNIFRNILTSSPLVNMDDEFYVSSRPKLTNVQNVTLERNTLLLISESSLLYFTYQDQNQITFLDNKFINNILIIAMDRLIGYTAPCLTFRGYNSVFNMQNNIFSSTAIRFEVYSLSMGGNALIAAAQIYIKDSQFLNSCQNIIDSSVAFSPDERQCQKNLTDIDETFLKFSDGGALNLFGTNQILIQNNIFQNNEAKRGGAIFLSGQVNDIYIQHNNFTQNSAIEGGVIYSEQVKVMNKILMSDLIFLGNSVLKYGVVLDSFLFFKHFEMENVIFANNYIRPQGSDYTYMVRLEKLGNCTVKISKVFFFGSNQQKFSGDYLQIYHSNQKDSRSNVDLIKKTEDMKPIQFEDCYFYIAGLQTSSSQKNFPQAVTIMSRKIEYNPVKTPVFLDNVLFTGENSLINFIKYFPQYGGNEYLLHFFDNSELKIIKYSSQAFYANNVDVIMNNTNVINILHYNGCVTVRNSYLQITNGEFEMNQKAAKYQNASQLMITSEKPEKHKSLIQNVKFKGYVPMAGEQQYDSQMISITNIQNVVIDNCNFTDASADYGSAIQVLEQVKNISITNSKFQNNWSRSTGGSVYISKDCSFLNIVKNTFKNSKSYYSLGGAIFIYKMNDHFNITQNEFYNNLAVFGNSISILSFDQNSLNSFLGFNTYTQNLVDYIALVHQFAQKAQQNKAIQTENQNVLYDWQQIIPSSEICLNFTISQRSFSYEWNFQQTTLQNSTSQQTFENLKVDEFIKYNNYQKTKSLFTNKQSSLPQDKELISSKIENDLSYITKVKYVLNAVGEDAVYTPIKPSMQTQFSSSYDTQNDILTIQNDQFVISNQRGYLQTVAFGVNNLITYNGYQQFLEILTQYNLVDQNKNSTYNLLYSDSQSLSSVVPNFQYFNKTTYQPYALGLGLSECDSGYSFDRTLRVCNYCQQGVYTLDPKGYSQCQPCVANSVCLGGYQLQVNEGYWRYSLYSSNVIYCNNNPYNCLVPESSNVPYTCKEGYQGPLCQACDNQNNYFSNGDGRCYTCNSNWITILIFITKKLIFLCYECFFIYTAVFANTLFATRGHECHALNVRRLNKVYVRIIQTYFQIMSLIISQYFIVGQELFNFVNQVFQIIGFPVDSVNYNYECWFYQFFGSKNEIYAYYASLISLCEPLFKISVVFVVWLIKRAFKIQWLKNRYFIISITSIILIEQLGVIQILLGSFKCISIPDGGSYMERNPNVSCQSDDYHIFTGFIYIPMMVLWAGGFTLLLFFYIFKNKKNLESKQMKLFFGFYYMCFRQKYFYWDVIIYMMKLLLLMLNYFVLDSDKLRFSCTTLILLGYCLAIKIYKPYTLDRQNKCDQILFYNLIFTMFLCYNIDNTNSNSLNILLIALLCISNLSFLGYISWRMFYIVRYFFKKFRSGVPTISKNSVKKLDKSLQEESEDEEQKNYLMQAELEYNHLEIAIKDENNEEVIIKEDDEEIQNINLKQGGGIIPSKKQETENIRQRYELHQYLKSMVEHNQNQPVQIDQLLDEDQEDSYNQDASPHSSNHNIGKTSFAFQKKGQHNQGGSILIQNNRAPAFKSFNNNLGKHEFGNKKKSFMNSQIGYDSSKHSNQQSVILNFNNNNPLKDSRNKESVEGASGASNNIKDNYYNQHENREFQSSYISHNSQHVQHVAALKKSFIHHVERQFMNKKKAKASMANRNYSNQYGDDEYGEYDDTHEYLHENYNNNKKKWTKSNVYVEDEVRQRNALVNKSELFQDQSECNQEQNQIDFTQSEAMDNNFQPLTSVFTNNNDTNILGSNIKVNQLNSHLFSDRRTINNKQFNPLTTRAPSTHIGYTSQQISTQQEVEGAFEAKGIHSEGNQDDSNAGHFTQDKKYESDSFYLKDKSNNFDDDDEDDDNEQKSYRDHFLSQEQLNMKNKKN